MLLDEIIALLSSEQTSLTDALLKTKVLLHQIGKKELAEWVNNELNGYPDDADLPSYRILDSVVLANLVSMTFRAESHPVPLMHLSDKQRESFERTPMRQSLTVLADLSSSSGSLSRPLPMEFTVMGYSGRTSQRAFI
jgi:hypothetical protein